REPRPGRQPRLRRAAVRADRSGDAARADRGAPARPRAADAVPGPGARVGGAVAVLRRPRLRARRRGARGPRPVRRAVPAARDPGGRPLWPSGHPRYGGHGPPPPSPRARLATPAHAALVLAPDPDGALRVEPADSDAEPGAPRRT